PGERIEIDRESRNQGLAFAGLHLGDLAFVQDYAADKLDVEMPLPQRALGGLAHGGECRHENIFERLAFGQLLFELIGASAQSFVRERFQLAFQRVDFVDARPVGANATVVGRTEQLAGDSADHRTIPWNLGWFGRLTQTHGLSGKPVVARWTVPSSSRPRHSANGRKIGAIRATARRMNIPIP